MVLRRWKRCLSTFTDVKISSNIDSFLVLLTFTGTLLPSEGSWGNLVSLKAIISVLGDFDVMCFQICFWP